MANGSKSFDWRAVAGFVALLVGLFTITGYLVDDKVDSKIQSHANQTEAIHQQNITKIKEDIAALKKGQANLELQNQRILEKLDRISERQ